jgi:excisionase family DNA binding protein
MAITDLQTHPAAYVRINELAQYFGVSRDTVHKWISCGLVVVIRPGRRKVVRILTTSARALEGDLSVH